MIEVRELSCLKNGLKQLLVILLLTCPLHPHAQPYFLIAHRGGVVDAHTQENSEKSIEKAIAGGFSMVEIDLRLTSDSVLIIHHDQNFKRYYGVDTPVDKMRWHEIQQLRSASGDRVLRFEDALRLCKGRMEVMIDNKLQGYDTLLFSRVVALLKQYDLLENALMIGTDESTAYFTGKIKLSCSRKQLEENRKLPGYDPAHYYLFADMISPEEAAWAKANGILAVGILNKYKFRNAAPGEEISAAKKIRSSGVTHFQIDSEYRGLFK